MSILGAGSLAMNPYMYLSGLSGVSGLGNSSLLDLSGLGSSNMLSFSGILQKALDSIPACECGCSAGQVQADVQKGTAGKKSSEISGIYTEYLQKNQNSIEQYRNSLRKSLIQSGKIPAQSSQSRVRQSSYRRHALDSYRTVGTKEL